MNRRAVLRIGGAAVVATLAGCFEGGMEDDDTTNPETGANTTSEPDHNTTSEPDHSTISISEAEARLNEVVDALAANLSHFADIAALRLKPDQDHSDLTRPFRTRYREDTERIDSRLTTARTALADVAPVLDTDERIAALQAIVEYQILLLKSHNLALDAIDHFHTANSYSSGETSIRELRAENARMDPKTPAGNAAELAHIEPLLDEMRELRADIHRAHDRLDTTPLDAPVFDDDTNPRQYYKYTVDELDIIESLVYNSRVGSYKGIERLLRGIEQVDAARWRDARQAFETAHERMASARDAFATIVENEQYNRIARDPREFGVARHSRDRIANFADVASTMVEAADTFEDNAETEAEELFADAIDSLEELYYPGVAGDWS